MKIKVPASDKPQTIIIKEKKGGCGCLVALIISGLLVWMMYSCCSSIHESAMEIASASKTLTPAQRAAQDIAKPNEIALDFQIRGCLRKYLNDPSSYSPIETRYADHKDGYAYVHIYRAKNAFGAYIKDCCGLLCATNTGKRVWTFYTQDQCEELLKGIKK